MNYARSNFIFERFAPLDCKDLGIQSDIVFLGDGQMQIIIDTVYPRDVKSSKNL